jgi:hypothetical protein
VTLVVARLTPLGVRLAADMRITDPDDAGPRGFLGAALKLILLSPTLCIGYAGRQTPALKAIRQVASEGLDADEATVLILDAHLRSEQAAEFLIASLRPSALVVVQGGGAAAREAGWIGDHAAFTEYQRFYLQERVIWPRDYYDSDERAGDMEIAARMTDGMEAVVNGPSLVRDGETTTVSIPEGGSHENVGEGIVNVVPRAEDNLFKYSVFGRFTASRFGSDAFQYSSLASDEPGVGAIGLYFDQAQLGLLYAPLLLDDPELLDNPQRYPSQSKAAFVEHVHQQYGISLQGLGP